ncbi:MAG: 2-oxoacid:acceptor oxidoreductase family protein [Deltaproteobacteria bacterium]|nr:2-oxoacid:acceptor oxidoreductase family protein [Deltaproteobacteria bacterium]
MERCRIVFSGAGGQGVITAAIILAEAAVLHEGLEATQTQSYGPEARGGATRAEVIIADAPIRYPKVTQPNVLVCLTQEAYNKYSGIIRPGGILLSDSRLVKPQSKVDARQASLPMYDSVIKEIGKPIVFNICMLGSVLGMTRIVSLESVTKSLQTHIPGEFFESSTRALALGAGLASNID